MNMDQINAVLAAHRVWSLVIAGGAPMVAISARIEDVEGQGACLVFSDGGRWRNPRVKDAQVAPDGGVSLRLPDWAEAAAVVMRPLTITHAQELNLPDVHGLDPSDVAHQVIFDSMFPS